MLVRRHSSGFHLHNFAFHPTPKLPLSQNAFTLYQSLWCGPTRPWRAASILLVITALRHHSTSTFRRGEIASPLSSHGLWVREESDVTRLNNVMFGGYLYLTSLCTYLKTQFTVYCLNLLSSCHPHHLLNSSTSLIRLTNIMAHLQFSSYKGFGEMSKEKFYCSQSVRVGDIIETAGQGLF